MVDDNTITKTVEKFFERDVQRDLMLIHSATSVSSPSFDGMPKGTSDGNGSENKMRAYSDAKTTINMIHSAFDLMDQDEADVLNILYLKGWTATKAAMTLCVATRSVYRLRKKELLDFAFAYRAGELIDRVTNNATATV